MPAKKRLKPVFQPEDSGLCGQACIATAAGVSLKRVVELLGDHPDGTTTRDMVLALRHFGFQTADRLHRVSKRKPVYPKHCLLSIEREGNPKERRKDKGHWMLYWDGHIHDPSGRWPLGYDKWRIKSYLEIYD